jgi:hypothetical protein
MITLYVSMSHGPVEMMGSDRVLPLITMPETMMILIMITLYVSMSLEDDGFWQSVTTNHIVRNNDDFNDDYLTC